jgi:hypothetical protein
MGNSRGAFQGAPEEIHDRERGGPVSSSDDRTIEAEQSLIRTRQDLLRFMALLRQDLRENRSAWENDTLETFLEALQAVLTDWDGRFLNRGESVPEGPTWRLLGEILAVAAVYE